MRGECNQRVYKMNGLKYLDDLKSKIIIFCGKGGVGKTTCAAATALHFALNNCKTLLLSTDPAPSLSDILEEDVGGKITSIKEVKNLDAIELDNETVLQNWKKEFGPEVYEVISSFLPVGKEIIDYVAGAPGMDEEYSLAYLLNLFESNVYDIVIWDTAPAGGTLTLLKLQEKFYHHLDEAGALYIRLKMTLAKLTRGQEKNPLELIRAWQKLARRILEMVKNKRTQAIVITIPEALGVNQTERVVKELENFGVNISKILVNYVINDQLCNCQFHRERREMQKKYLNILEERYREKPGLVFLPQFAQEVKGIENIKKIESLLFK